MVLAKVSSWKRFKWGICPKDPAGKGGNEEIYWPSFSGATERVSTTSFFLFRLFIYFSFLDDIYKKKR